MAADAQIPFLRQHLKRSKKAFTLRQLRDFTSTVSDTFWEIAGG